MSDGTWLDMRGLVIPAAQHDACARALIERGHWTGDEGASLVEMLATESLIPYERSGDEAVAIVSAGEWIVDAVDEDLWTAIAPYVTPGATIIAEVQGEDGREYDLYLFADARLYRLPAHTMFNLAEASLLSLDKPDVGIVLDADALRAATGVGATDTLTLPLAQISVLVRPS